MIYFVTGTDTGVGKTHVTAALVAGLRTRGRPARAVKPIETGWNETTSDAAALAAASERSLDETILWRLALPRSPSAAARAEGRSIDPRALLAWCRARDADPLLVEGAGGWMVPILDRWRMRDLAEGLDAPVVIVGRAGLGTINHCVLTAEAAPSAHGIILSRRPDDDLDFARENAAEIRVQICRPVAIFPDDLDAILGWFTPRGAG
jgi:dethiobiotin synthetase